MSTTKAKTSSEDMDLKSSIIEFMRTRPFLWNSKHPNYKDHKRRDQEFQAFSKEIGYPVQEIKRVWHVLRTNFFRAHKILLERPQVQSNSRTSGSGAGGSGGSAGNGGGSENGAGEKLWKYYLAMEYVLEGTNLSPAPIAGATTTNTSNNNSINHTDDSSSSKETKQTTSGGKGSKLFKDLRGARRDMSTNDASLVGSTNETGKIGIKSNGNLTIGDNILAITTTTTSPSSCDISNTSLANSLSLVSVNSHTNNNKSITTLKNLNNSSLAWDSYMEADEDHLYARSLTSSLKKFDPTTKEVIKLKFQEIIVDYMQRQQPQANNTSAPQQKQQQQTTKQES